MQFCHRPLQGPVTRVAGPGSVEPPLGSAPEAPGFGSTLPAHAAIASAQRKAGNSVAGFNARFLGLMDASDRASCVPGSEATNDRVIHGEHVRHAGPGSAS